MRALLQRHLPPGAKLWLNRYRAAVKRYFTALAVKGFWFSWAAYSIDPNFYGDFRGHVLGVNKYNRRLSVESPNIALLRRNLHRIEKGICHKSRRPIFAREYILETVKAYSLLRRCPELEGRSEVDWGWRVLSHYFHITDDVGEEYIQAKTIFFNLDGDGQDRLDESVFAYSNNFGPKDGEWLMGLLRQRKSIRHFEKGRVPYEVISNALRAASFSPSSCNRQPYCYYIRNSADKAQELAAISAGTAGWLDEIQCLAVVVGDLSYFPNSVNRHSIYVDAALSVMPFVLSLEAQGFSTCLINWADSRDRRIRMERLLGIESHQRVVVSIAIGRAAESSIAPMSLKKQEAEISSNGL